MFDEREDNRIPHHMVDSSTCYNSIFNPYDPDYTASFSEAHNNIATRDISPECNIFEHLSIGFCAHCEHSFGPGNGQMYSSSYYDQDNFFCAQNTLGFPEKCRTFSECGTFDQSSACVSELDSQPPYFGYNNTEMEIEQSECPQSQPVRTIVIKASSIQLPDVLEEKRKSTNAPKYFIKIGINAFKTHSLRTNNSENLEWIASFEAKYNGSPNTISHLGEFLCPASAEVSEQGSINFQELNQTQQKISETTAQGSSREVSRAEQARRVLQRELGMNKGELTLANKSISEYNRANYLYFMKVYEWRLNDEKLVLRLT